MSLRWVFVYDEWYNPFLFEAGFELSEVWPSGVVLFEKPTVPEIHDASRPTDLRTRIAGYDWGALPLACLLCTGLVGPLTRRASRQRLSAAQKSSGEK
jgi:hypothetical protein